MKRLFLLSILVLFVVNIQAETASQLQEKLRAAQAEIEQLKTKIATMQAQVDTARAASQQPPTSPLDQALGVAHPIVTAYEIASYSESDPTAVKDLLRGKVVSVTGAIDRFSEGFGRGFKVFFNTNGSPIQVGGDFNAASSVRSTYTAEDGAEMVVEDEKKGKFTLAAINDKVVISGFFDRVTRRQILLNNCVLQKQ